METLWQACIKRKTATSGITIFHLTIKDTAEALKQPIKKTAQQIANSIETDLARQQHGLTALNKNSDKFGDIFKDYLNELVCAKKTLELRVALSKHFLCVFQDKPVKTISILDREEYRRNRRLDVLSNPKNINKKDSEISFRTVNLEISTMHNFFNYCIKKALSIKTPAPELKN
jgi:hypothetical protein